MAAAEISGLMEKSAWPPPFPRDESISGRGRRSEWRDGTGLKAGLTLLLPIDGSIDFRVAMERKVRWSRPPGTLFLQRRTAVTKQAHQNAATGLEATWSAV
jgi:hypothetical protein